MLCLLGNFTDEFLLDIENKNADFFLREAESKLPQTGEVYSISFQMSAMKNLTECAYRAYTEN